MCDCFPSALHLCPSGITCTAKTGLCTRFSSFNFKARTFPVSDTVSGSLLQLTDLRSSDSSSFGQVRSIVQGMRRSVAKSSTSFSADQNSMSLGSDRYELEFMGKEPDEIRFESAQIRTESEQPKDSLNTSSSVVSDELRLKDEENPVNQSESRQSGKGKQQTTSIRNGFDTSNASDNSSAVDFLQFNQKSEEKSARKLKDEDLIRVEESDKDVELMLEELDAGPTMRSARQLMRRSNMIAKQVISMQSAMSLGFISQLWVDTTSWAVLVVEVRPNLLSGELEKFLLEDVRQVGDVVLIKDETVIEKEFKLGGLETLVGYNVVTGGGRNIGKVRGYTFNIDSGAVESLELDSFGISIIPSSLVSTYALFVEDVLEVVSDSVVVHEAAASRIQKVTKGFWDGQNMGNSIDKLGEFERQASESVQQRRKRRKRKGFPGRKSSKLAEDDWELPMDYL